MLTILAVVLGCVSIITNLLWLKSKLSSKSSPQQMVSMDNAHMHVELKTLQKDVQEMPNKMLQTIIGSTNTHKGALGELIGYIQLRASYDRIIPLGNIVDFVAIKFPEGDTPGHIDFIDIKTGDKSRLSKDQRGLQKLIEEKKINFIKLKVETNNETQPPTNQSGI